MQNYQRISGLLLFHRTGVDNNSAQHDCNALWDLKENSEKENNTIINDNIHTM